MNEIIYRKLTEYDIPAFIEIRLKQLREEGDEPVFDLIPLLNKYYEEHLSDGTFVSWLAADMGKIIATSGMSFIEKPPCYSNPSGKIGILSSMYTLKEYRRQGIAKQLLIRVIQEAGSYGCGAVQITASDVGTLLYADFGFLKNENFMQYTIKSI